LLIIKIGVLLTYLFYCFPLLSHSVSVSSALFFHNEVAPWAWGVGAHLMVSGLVGSRNKNVMYFVRNVIK